MSCSATPTQLAAWASRGPRYTSYPPATAFSTVYAGSIERELARIGEARESISLYLHIPFCRSLCWYYGGWFARGPGGDPPADRRRRHAAQLADGAGQLAALEGLPMTILYFILPLALLLAGGAVAAFVWTVRSGQLDDVDTPPRRILFDDEPRRLAYAVAPG